MTVRLHCVYRSYGGENDKDRPPYYSKLLALTSFLRAVEEANQPVEVFFLNDGPIPQDCLRLMVAAGKVVTLDSVGTRGSYRAALSLALGQGWDDDDIVWFSEDDYLYLPQAFSQLMRAADVISYADYFGLYASTAARPVGERVDYEAALPPGWREFIPIDVNGHGWVNVLSTASTFGGRLGVLRDDIHLFLQCMLGLRHAFRDHETCLMFQGIEPYRWRQIVKEIALGGEGGLARRAKLAALTPINVWLNLRSHRRPHRRRLLFAPDPNLATHLTLPVVAPGVNWESVAEQTALWAATNSSGSVRGGGHEREG